MANTRTFPRTRRMDVGAMNNHPLIEFQKIQQLPKNERTEALLQWIQKILGEERSEAAAFPFGPIPHWISLDLEKPEEEQICIFCDCYTGYWSQGYLLDGKVEWMGYGHIPNDLIPTHFLIPPPPPEPPNE